MLLVGAAYAVTGVGFSALGASDGSHGSVVAWRLAAWLASAALGAAHVGYEHFRLGNPPRLTALHAAGAVALGALGLAVAANVHWLVAETRSQRPPLLALPIWPVITALPAFLAALAVATVLGRVSRRGRRGGGGQPD